MLTRQPLILALALSATFSVPGANGQALEENATLPFALKLGKALVTPPKPFIEVSSTERVYISEANVLALADTQCMYTETPPVQLCLGNRWPSRIRFLPHGHLKIGLHSLGLSRLAYLHHPSFVTEALLPGQDGLPELHPMTKAILTHILQGVARQEDIIENAKQRSLMFSHLNNNKSGHTLVEEPLGEGDIEEDNDPIEWWGFAQQSVPAAPDTNDSDVIRVRLENNILLKPDTRYCFVPDARTKGDHQKAPDEGSGSEDNNSSDENSDNDSDEEDTKTNTESDVEWIGTTPDPFPVSREIRDYCAGLEQRKIKQEPPSDSEMPIGPEVAIAEAVSTYKLPADPPSATRKKSRHRGKKPLPCQKCGKTFTQKSSLKRHQRTHSGEKPYPCQECGKAFTQNSSLKIHLLTHSGEKPCRCQECGKAFAQSSNLKTHLRTHSGEKPHSCKKCGKAFSDRSALSRHQRTHSSEKPYLCQECGKTFARGSTLKIHQRTHKMMVGSPARRKCINETDEEGLF